MVEFSKDGVLPAGVHKCSEVEFRKLLVEDFPDSTTRVIIASGFSKLRDDAHNFGVSGLQWVDGSYVTTKTDPNDIDVVTFIDVNLLDSLSSASAVSFVGQVLAGGKETPSAYCSDTYVVGVAPADHPHHAAFQLALEYWRKWFGHMRTLLDSRGAPFPARKKGIVQMDLGDTNDILHLAVRGGATNE